MYDVIVVGARCAGASTAMLLSRRGYRVLLVDRAIFPRDIPHGHFIHKHGPGRLHRWGLLDRVAATNCPPIESMVIDLGDFPLTGRKLAMDGVAMGYGPRRDVLDKLLVDAAVEAGTELRQGFVVDDFLSHGGRITGIRGHDAATGSVALEHAPITVGADGRHSRLARTVRAAEYDTFPVLSCWYFSYWSGMPPMGLEVYQRGRNAILTFPTNDELVAIFIAWTCDEFESVKSDIERSFMAVVDQVPGLAERVRNGRREERFYGTADLPNFLRKPCGRGWALVGDAGCHKDPYMALGICDAFRDAELLAEAVDQAFSGRVDPGKALHEYERRRNAATMRDYLENAQIAQLRPIPDEVLRLRSALRESEEDARLFFLAREELIPRESFFNHENIARLVTRARA